MPRLLIIRLVRWGNNEHEANLECVRADDLIEYQDHHYRLCGTVIRFGPSPDRGHYVAVVKHNDSWWLYDDTCRQEATEEQVATMQRDYPGYGNMKSYLLLYEMLGNE